MKKKQNRDIYDINEWLRQRLSNEERDTQNKNSDSAVMRDRYIENKIKEIVDVLGIQKEAVKLVTLRSRFRKNQTYLRPIYSRPDVLRDYLVNPDKQVPFSFKGELKNIFADLDTSFDTEEAKLPKDFAAYYRLEPNYSCDDSTCSLEASKAFATRINTFWKGMENSDEKELIEIAKKKNIHCIFAGRNKQEDNDSELKVELEHIVAIYFTQNSCNLDNKLQEIKEISSVLFEEINLITKIDSNLFKKEGLEIVAKKLMHVFSNNSKAPADKISTAIRILESHLKKYLIGGRSKKHLVDDPQEQQPDPKVFYLSASFEQKENNVFFPHLNIYPLCYRTKYPLGSYQVAHKRIPSAVKFLLYKYLTSENIKVLFGGDYSNSNIAEQKYIEAEFDEDFKKLFYDNKLFGDKNSKSNDPNWYENIWSQKSPDQLHMVPHDEKWKNFSGKTPWNVLNRFLEPNEENNSIVAFVVEGKTLSHENDCYHKAFPIGVLAIESPYVDAFSDEDIEALKILAEAIASLIRQVTHHNSPLDFRSNITNAFGNKHNFFQSGNWAQGGQNELRAKRIILAAHKIDITQLKTICDTINNKLYEKYKITDKDFKQIKDLYKKLKDLPYTNGEDPNKKEIPEIINERFEKLFEWFKDYSPNDVSNSVIDFFEACPENFVWAGFFMSLGQALGDRVSDAIPNFSFMTPGYSASSMFMATVKGELRQVVKLASKDKLEKERNNYSKYVRYCIVNSARIPKNGYAFDTHGKEGMKDEIFPNDVPYGALVSDLVSAETKEPDYIVTLLSIIASYFLGTGKKEKAQEISNVQNKLQILFNEGLSLWQKPKQVNEGRCGSIIRKAFRLPETWDNNQKTDKTLNEDKYQYNLSQANTKFNRIIKGHIDTDSNLIPKRFNDNDLIPVGNWSNGVNLSSIGHGDLNARNLTWSGGLESFFMIDFEYVGLYFKGADQYRLAVNLVVDVVSEVYAVAQNNHDINKASSTLCPAIDKSVELITEFYKKLSTNAVSGYEASLAEVVLVNVFELEGKEIPSDNKKKVSLAKKKVKIKKGDSLYSLCFVIITLFSTLNNIFTVKNPNKKQWLMKFYGYVLFCSVLKEFDYSCRPLDNKSDETIENISKELNYQIDTIPSLKLFDIISKKSKEHKTTHLRSIYFKHFISAKMLYLISR